MEVLSDDVLYEIFQHCTTRELCLTLSLVCTQWSEMSSKVIQYTRVNHGHCLMIGPYVLQNHFSTTTTITTTTPTTPTPTTTASPSTFRPNNNKLELISLLSKAKLQSWSCSSTLYIYHSTQMVHDEFCCYYWDWDDHHPNNNNNNSIVVVVQCMDLETKCILWRRALVTSGGVPRSPASALDEEEREQSYTSADSILSQSIDSSVVCITSTKNLVHVISKKNDYYAVFDTSPSTIINTVLTPNYVIVEATSDIYIVRKPDITLMGDNKPEIIYLTADHCISCNRAVYSSSIIFSSIYVEYVTRNREDVFYVDRRTKGLASIFLDCYDCKTGRLKFTGSVASLTGYVDLTVASPDKWCLTGCTFDRIRETHLIDLSNGSTTVFKGSYSIVPRVFSSTNNLQSFEKTIGLCSLDDRDKTCSFFLIDQEEEELGEHQEGHNNNKLSCQWTINLPEITRFKYRPTLQILVLKDVMYLLTSGGAGCILYCIHLESGKLIWKDAMLRDVLKDNHYSHFDVHVKMIALNVEMGQVCVSGTIKHCAFFCFLFDKKRGNSFSKLSTWKEHEELTSQLQLLKDSLGYSNNNNNNSGNCDSNAHHHTKKCQIM